MGRTVLLISMFAALAASSLVAQEIKAGDLMPRNGIIAYFASDKPDVFYRLFGKDEKGEYRLKSMMNAKSAMGPSNPEAEKAAKEQQDLLFGMYDKMAGFEMGFLDVTMGGAKFVLHMRAREGQTFDFSAPLFQKMLKEEKTIAGFKVKVYQMPGGEKSKTAGLDQSYVVAVSDGIVVSNFETTITDTLTRLAAKDFSESLSSRPEFAAWRDERKPHDLSLFIVGRELQAAVERMLPSKDQAKRDLPGAYSALDGWLQLREYKSITIDFDFDEKNGGIELNLQLNTQRRTKLLEKLAIEPADFKLLGLLPANVTMIGGLQLGDAPTTFDNLLAFARDAETAARLAKKTAVPPPDDKDDKKPDDPKPEEPKPGKPTLDEMMAKFDKDLGAMGSSVKEVVGLLGTELIVFSVSDPKRVAERKLSRPDEVLRAGRMGVIVGLKDTKAAQALIDKAKEKDGAGMGKLDQVEHGGTTIYLGTLRSFGYAFTDNALLVVFSPSKSDDKDADVLTDLKSMLDGRTKAREIDPTITRCSKFLTVRVGDIAGMMKTVATAAAEGCLRDAKPLMGNEWFEYFGKTTMTLRLNETKDSIAIGVKVVGLPPLGSALDGMMSFGKGTGAERAAAWGYAQSNARELARGLRSFLNKDEGSTLSFDAALKMETIRKAHLQSPFDKNWKGSTAKLRYFSINNLRRDKDGKLPPWVDADAVAVVEENEKAGFVSFTLAEGATDTFKGYMAGFIAAYQSSPDTFGGRIVIYGDDEIGWLSEKAFQQALELNKTAVAVPAPMAKPGEKRDPEDDKPRSTDGPSPWGPGGGKSSDKKGSGK
ncbi:MAG: hypothetical protein IT462_03250 [Planctomycetes bacterium]|nr:hypothetical protein [Planctomycetota bacterium]